MAHTRHGWRRHVAGGHVRPREATCTPVRGATWQGGWQLEGPQVSGTCWWIKQMTWDMSVDRGLDYACNHDRPANLDQIRPLEIFAKNFHTIAARLPCDRGLIEPRSWLIRGAIIAHDHLTLVGHDCREIVTTNRRLFPDQTAEIFGRKSPLKTDVFLLIS